MSRSSSRSRPSSARLTAEGTGFDLPVDAAMLRRVMQTISSAGSHPSGFRVSGTPEDREVTESVAADRRSSRKSDGAGAVSVAAARGDHGSCERAFLNCAAGAADTCSEGRATVGVARPKHDR